MMFRLLFIFFFLELAGPSFAQMNYYQVEKKETPAKPAVEGFGAVVTPIEDCFGKFDEKDVVDMRKNFERPYHECRRRLAEKEAAEKKPKEAETPQKDPYYYRIRKPKETVPPPHPEEPEKKEQSK